MKVAEVSPYVKLVRGLMEDPKAKPLGAIKGLTYRVYHGKWTKLPKFDELNPAASGALALFPCLCLASRRRRS